MVWDKTKPATNGAPVSAQLRDNWEALDARGLVVQLGALGSGVAITTGVKAYIVLPANLFVTGWSILGNASGSIVLDVWRDTYANFPPTVADTIAGSEKPTLSSQQKNQDLTLTTWTQQLLAGEVLAINVDSVSGLEAVWLTLHGRPV